TFLYVFQNIRNLDLRDPKIYYDILIIPCVKIFTPIAVVAVIVGIASNYGQIGFRFSPKAIKPNFQKLIPNVFKFFKNQVFSISSAFNLVKSIVKVAIIVAISYMLTMGKIQEIQNLMNNEDLFYALTFISKLCFDLILQVLIVLLVMAFVDYIFVRWQFEEQMKMKKQEVKEEYKELYGDPNVKGRLKQMYRDILSQKKMLNEVPKADMVITNPTHYAVALKYESSVDSAPRVIAKGEDKFAQMIKEVAKEYDIFMYENVPLARTLYNEVEVNDIIPSNLYSLVINAYRLLYEKRQKAKV
ncbi:MAG TPA: EscU/YscU/HrcU family type III secretion system export apparatus switch protein, partial [Spirochaetota bacterium]|nr:EscU/YscU/HrcU family type III secretion system export apparatus switch protein [Spirochaetota bacterium]